MPRQAKNKASEVQVGAEARIFELEQEVAKLKANQEKLREEQAMYIQMLDAIHDMILVKDRQSRIVYANRSFRDYYGMSLEELAGIVDAPFNQLEYTKQYLIDDAFVMDTGQTLVVREEPATRHDGQVHFFNTIKSPIFNSRGDCTQMVAVCRDVTVEREAELLRQRTEKALNESERLFAQMAEGMRDVFFVAEPGLRHYFYVSPAFERLWGHSCTELLSNPRILLDGILEQDRKAFLSRVEAACEPPFAEVNHEFRVMRNGEIIWLWCRAYPVLDADGKVFRICGIAHDISDRKEVERRVSEFNGMVSHELRTPLTSIRAALGLIEGGQTDLVGDGTLELINIARGECDRLVRLINDLLDIKKIEADKLELKIKRLKADDVLTAVLHNMQGIAVQSNLTLVAQSIPVEVDGDRDRLIQVLINLVSNAVKVSPENSTITLSVALSAEDAVRFAVSDVGPGIPESARDKLFTAFQQIDCSSTRSQSGTGLGLAISKAIVERHGGRIGFDTVCGEGSTFWFELKRSGAS